MGRRKNKGSSSTSTKALDFLNKLIIGINNQYSHLYSYKHNIIIKLYFNFLNYQMILYLIKKYYLL